MKKHIKITNKGYGRKWQNFKIHYIGIRPKLIRDDGVFTSGKSILEMLAVRFKKFELILCETKSKILKRGKVFQVFLSLNDLRPMNSSLINQKKDVTQRAIAATFSLLFRNILRKGRVCLTIRMDCLLEFLQIISCRHDCPNQTEMPWRILFPNSLQVVSRKVRHRANSKQELN